jgi:tRNA/rRNA methyltransferase
MKSFPVRVVLVGPGVAENLGATARIMRNFGFSELTLVCPEVRPDERQARRLSTHGESILDQARIVEDFGEAVADCVFVCATSARTGKLIRGQFEMPWQMAGQVVDSLATGPAALVFGPERTGLTDTEIARCHRLVHIPSENSYPALNLAQAVAICLYEVRCAVLERSASSVTAESVSFGSERAPGLEPPDPPIFLDRSSGTSASPQADPAPFREQDAMFNHLQQSLEAIHFLYGPKADSLIYALRHLIGRARPTQMEIGILHGLARQILWYVNGRR